MRILAHQPSRNAFFLLWGGWTVVAVLAAALYQWFHETGLVAAVFLVITACSVAAVEERRFRLKNLPPEARRPWHTFLVLPLLTVSILVLVVGNEFGHYLPGSEREKGSCQLTIKRLDATEQDLEFLFTYEWRKGNWGPTTSNWAFSESRIWMRGQEGNAWVLDAHVQEGRSATEAGQIVLLDTAGYEELVRALVGESAGDDQVKRSAASLEDVLSLIHSGYAVSWQGGTETFDCDADSVVRDSRAVFFWIAAVLFSLLLIPVTVVVVGATMYPEVGDE